MATTQYIGARYVPVFAESEWSSTNTYEPLTIVMGNSGNSYTSRQFVPKGIELTDTNYWALTGNYNAQVESYRRETAEAVKAVAAEEARAKDAEATEESRAKDAEAAIELEYCKCYDTVADMKSDDTMKLGMIVHTNRFYEGIDGGSAWYVVESEASGEIGMDSIKLGTSDTMYANLVITENKIIPKQLGAYGDNLHDDSDVIIRCVEIANGTDNIVFLTSGNYKLSKQLALASKTTFEGYSPSDTIITSDYDGYLMTMTTDCIVRNIKFIGNKSNYGINATGGWTSEIEDCHFQYFICALNLKADDMWIHKCQITHCGGIVSGSPIYAVELVAGCNHKRIELCHFEHCRYFLHSSNSIAFNYITNCKFEQSTYGLNTNLSSPINCEPVYVPSNYGIAFTNCTFACLWEDIYLNEATFTSYDNAPFFLYAGNCKVSNCDFYGNAGSSDNLDPDESKYTGYKPVIAIGFSLVENSRLTSIMKMNNCIRLADNSKFIGNSLYAQSSKTPKLSIPQFYSYIYDGNQFAYNNITDKNALLKYNNGTNNVLTSDSSAMPNGATFPAGSGFNTIKMHLSTNTGQVIYIPIFVRSNVYGGGYGIEGRYIIGINRNHAENPAGWIDPSFTGNKGDNMSLKVYYNVINDNECLFTFQINQISFSPMMMKFENIEGLPVTVWADSSTAECTDTLLLTV